MLYMLDTDMSSYIIRKRPFVVLESMQAKSQEGTGLCISAATYAELLLGAERSVNPRKHHKLIVEFCVRLDAIKPWDDKAAESFSKLQAHLFRKWVPIGINDTMIAGHALSINATLVTNNKKHFPKVPKLKLDNWAI